MNDINSKKNFRLMKKISFLLLSLLIASLSAQDVTTNWPYMYPEFTDGVMYMSDGNEVNSRLNLYVVESKVHFIEKDIIKELLTYNVDSVKIADDSYIFRDNKAIRVIKKAENGFVGELITGDIESLRETGGAYGSSSTTQSTRRLSSVEGSNKVNQNHMIIWQDKHLGQPIDIDQEYLIITGESVFKASRRGLERNIPRENRGDFRNFLKGKNIKWNEPESLVKVLEFFEN